MTEKPTPGDPLPEQPTPGNTVPERPRPGELVPERPMPEGRRADAEVLVVGAGPTGLLLAGDLAEAGVRVRLLERRPAQDTALTRAFAVHARTLEQLDARGLADELLATG